MIIVTVSLIGSLRAISKKSRFVLKFDKAVMLRKAVERIVEEQPMTKQALIDPEFGDNRANVLMLVNGKEISVLDGLETLLHDGDELVIVPVVHGG